jgi:phosphonate transport system substrate-binding protein
MMTRKLFIVMTLLLVLSLLAGCSTGPTRTVSLHKTDANTAIKDKTPGQVPIRVAVSSILSPKETITVYQPLVDYLEDKLGHPVVLLQRRTYKEVNDLLQGSGADVAFVCSGGYVAGNESFGMELLAVPQVKGAILYQSYIIARDNTSKSIMDLRGRSFAFTDPMSFSGRIAPVYMLVSHGADSDRFFSRTFYTYSHDNAIRAVADGIADAAAVDSMIFDRAVDKEPELGKRVFIIDRSLKVGNPPVVVNPSINQDLKQRLRDVLLKMNGDERGQKVLTALSYDKFVVADDKEYAELKNVWRATRERL